MLSVLVVSPDPSVPGGVSVFIECMKRHVIRSRIDSFFVGSPGRGKQSVTATLVRLIIRPFQLAHHVRKSHFDVVHINPSFDIKSLTRDSLFILALQAVGFRRILFYFHGWDFSVHQSILKNVFLRSFFGWVLNKAAVITVLSEDFREGLAALGIDPARIIVTQTMFESLKLKQQGPENNKSTRRFILFLSRFDPEKGGRELLQAFAALKNDYSDLDLVMAGDGSDRDFLYTLAERLSVKERVVFPGYIGGDAKERLLRGCTLFALPTYYRSEGMPVSVLEAMGAGKPLLVGSAGAMRSIARDPDNGVVLTEITPKNIESGLRRLLDDPAFADEAGKRNATTAAVRFRADVVTAEIEKFYQRVAQC